MPGLSLFVDWPMLALLPAACFFILAVVCRRPVIWGAGVAWAAFAGYQLLFRYGVLCSSGCEGRTDLLFIYPFLAVASLVAMGSALRGRRETEVP